MFQKQDNIESRYLENKTVEMYEIILKLGKY